MSFSQNLARLKMSDRQQTRPHEGSRWGNFRRAGRKGKSEKPLERKTDVLAKDWPWAGHASEARKQCHMSSKLKKSQKNKELGERRGGDRGPPPTLSQEVAREETSLEKTRKRMKTRKLKGGIRGARRGGGAQGRGSGARGEGASWPRRLHQPAAPRAAPQDATSERPPQTCCSDWGGGPRTHVMSRPRRAPRWPEGGAPRLQTAPASQNSAQTCTFVCLFF